ncbi:MAG: LysE family transporter [Actinomycetia bacterium]|nr:LysE family transporter [Actinomycetes bacterium]
MSHYLSGLLLGLGLILPIGSQNVYVLKSAMRLGLPRSFWIALIATSCDSLLIIIGALGASAALTAVPGLRPALLIAGTLFLLFLGIQALRAPLPASEDNTDAPAVSLPKTALGTVTVSLLNPHAIIDTVGVIGLAISVQPDQAAVFGAGAISASLIWFLFLAVAGSLLARRLTPKVRQWIERATGLILLLFSLRLLWEALVLLGVLPG